MLKNKITSLKDNFLSFNIQQRILVTAVIGMFVYSGIVITVSIALKSQNAQIIQTSTANDAANKILVGDNNGDGVVNSLDIESLVGDVNGDGVVDSADIAFVENDKNSDGIVDSNDSSISLPTNVEAENNDAIASTINATDGSEPNTNTPISQDTGEVASAPASSNGTTYTIGTWNVYKNNTNDIGEMAKKIMQAAQVVGFQEVHSSEKINQMKKISCASCAYAMYMPSSGDSYPLLWNKSIFTKENQGSSWMSSPPNYAVRYAVWVKLKNNITGKSAYYINTHLPHLVESGGDLVAVSPNKDAYKTHMTNLLKMINKFKLENIPIFIVGDFNVNHRKDCKVSIFPCIMLAKDNDIVSGWSLTTTKLIGIKSTQGTHIDGTRLIDYVMAWKRPDVTAIQSTIIESKAGANGWGGSDHKPSLLTVTVK